MPGPLDDYFAKHEYLPLRPSLRQRLIAVVGASASQEVRRAAFEEGLHAYPVFAFNLLKFVNSPTFNLQTKVVRLKQAAALPSLDQLGKMLAATPDYPEEAERVFSLRRFEEHGRAAAVAVQILAHLGKRFGTMNRERLYTATMLHDMGRLFLVLSDPQGYARLLAESSESAEPGSILEAEKKYFGTDHAMVGAASIERIGIPDPEIIAAVRDHHGVPAGPNVLVAYADRVVKRFGIGLSGGGDLFQSSADEVKLKVALEESIHLTVGEALMHVLTEIDTQMTVGMINFRNLAGRDE